jgi:hypothetical protein
MFSHSLLAVQPPGKGEVVYTCLHRDWVHSEGSLNESISLFSTFLSPFLRLYWVRKLCWDSLSLSLCLYWVRKLCANPLSLSLCLCWVQKLCAQILCHCPFASIKFENCVQILCHYCIYWARKCVQILSLTPLLSSENVRKSCQNASMELGKCVQILCH